MHKRNNLSIKRKFVNKNCLFYLNDILEYAPLCRIDTRNSFAKLKHPFRKTNTGQKTFSCNGPSLWNNLPETIKKTNNLSSSKNKVKVLYLNQQTDCHCHCDYLGLLLYYHYYLYYPQYYLTIFF